MEAVRLARASGSAPSADLHALAGMEAVTSPFVCLKRLGGQTRFADKREL
jgi:hypothetical protein